MAVKIGIALPTNVPGVEPASIIEWARKTDSAPFSTLAANDRLAYATHDPLAVLAAASAVTLRVRLMTSILIPLHTQRRCPRDASRDYRRAVTTTKEKTRLQ